MKHTPFLGALLAAPLLAGTALPQATQLHSFHGDGTGDDLGLSVAAAGDVNGDGTGDVIVGAPELDQFFPFGIGYARVLSGTDGAVLHHVAGLRYLSSFGQAVAGVGDLNGDGKADFAIGAPSDYQTGGSSNAAGAVYVYSGADGALLHSWFATSLGDSFGYSVASAGDVNGDGTSDVVVGSPLADPQGQSSGLVRVFSGADGSLLREFHGAAAQEGLGVCVAGAGDVNNDGRADVIAGTSANRAKVFSGMTGALLRTFTGDSDGDSFGQAVAGVGDIDRDGWDDVAVGAKQDDNVAAESGSVRVYSGRDGSVLYTWNGTTVLALFGRSLAGANIDGDEYPDVFVGASGYAVAFSGRDGTELFTITEDSPFNGFAISVQSAGDVDNDGRDELLVGVPTDDPNGDLSGSARVFDPPAASTGPTTYCQTSLNSAGTRATIGWSGSLSVSGNSFTLTVDGAVPGTSGIFFYGTDQVQVPFGDGTLCVGGGTYRLNPGVVVGAAGSATRPADFDRAPMDSGPGAVLPGSTWYFQFWYRDVAYGNDRFNLSNGLCATFQP